MSTQYFVRFGSDYGTTGSFSGSLVRAPRGSTANGLYPRTVGPLTLGRVALIGNINTVSPSTGWVSGDDELLRGRWEVLSPTSASYRIDLPDGPGTYKIWAGTTAVQEQILSYTILDGINGNVVYTTRISGSTLWGAEPPAGDQWAYITDSGLQVAGAIDNNAFDPVIPSITRTFTQNHLVFVNGGSGSGYSDLSFISFQRQPDTPQRYFVRFGSDYAQAGESSGTLVRFPHTSTSSSEYPQSIGPLTLGLLGVDKALSTVDGLGWQVNDDELLKGYAFVLNASPSYSIRVDLPDGPGTYNFWLGSAAEASIRTRWTLRDGVSGSILYTRDWSGATIFGNDLTLSDFDQWVVNNETVSRQIDDNAFVPEPTPITLNISSSHIQFDFGDHPDKGNIFSIPFSNISFIAFEKQTGSLPEPSVTESVSIINFTPAIGRASGTVIDIAVSSSATLVSASVNNVPLANFTVVNPNLVRGTTNNATTGPVRVSTVQTTVSSSTFTVVPIRNTFRFVNGITPWSPLSSPVNGTPYNFQVEAWNSVASQRDVLYTGSITLGVDILSNLSGTITGTLTQTAVSGVASFTNIIFNNLSPIPTSSDGNGSTFNLQYVSGLLTSSVGIFSVQNGPTKIIPIRAERWATGSGNTLIDIGVPLRQGQLMSSSISQVSVWLNNTEIPVYVETLGVYPDGSARSLYIQASENLSSGSNVLGELRLTGGFTQARRTFVDNSSTWTNSFSGTGSTGWILGGLPQGVIVPTNAAHLCAAAWGGPLTPQSTQPTFVGSTEVDVAFTETFNTGILGAWDGGSPWGPATYDRGYALLQNWFRTADTYWLRASLSAMSAMRTQYWLPADFATPEWHNGQYDWMSLYLLRRDITPIERAVIVSDVTGLNVADLRGGFGGRFYAQRIRHVALAIAAGRGNEVSEFDNTTTINQLATSILSGSLIKNDFSLLATDNAIQLEGTESDGVTSKWLQYPYMAGMYLDSLLFLCSVLPDTNQFKSQVLNQISDCVLRLRAPDLLTSSSAGTTTMVFSSEESFFSSRSAQIASEYISGSSTIVLKNTDWTGAITSGSTITIGGVLRRTTTLSIVSAGNVTLTINTPYSSNIAVDTSVSLAIQASAPPSYGNESTVDLNGFYAHLFAWRAWYEDSIIDADVARSLFIGIGKTPRDGNAGPFIGIIQGQKQWDESFHRAFVTLGYLQKFGK